MKIKFTIIFLLKSIINVFVNYINTFPKNRDFLFEFELLINYNFNFDDEIFIHVVNFIIIFILIRNFTKISIIFFKRIRFNTIVKYLMNDCYQIFYKFTELITCK